MSVVPETVHGRYYDGRTAAATDVVLRVDAYGVLHLEPPLQPPVPPHCRGLTTQALTCCWLST